MSVRVFQLNKSKSLHENACASAYIRLTNKNFRVPGRYQLPTSNMNRSSPSRKCLDGNFVLVMWDVLVFYQ